ncbi:MAG: riboflavin biosynthesis protein RibF [Planctomycetota bacterium]
MSAQSIITIGNFDGVHIGHREIVQQARRLAAPHDAEVIAVTFDPPPIAVLRPQHSPPRLGPIDQRIDALRNAGADRVVVLEPAPQLLSLSAEQFIEKLVADHSAVGFVEGEDFRFGKERGGDTRLLAELGRARGFEVSILPRVETRLSDQARAPVSSSLVRWLVGRGRVEDAAACLGRDYELVGQIVRGDQRGRTIGIPTANLDPAAYRTQITPMDGVYAGRVQVDGRAYPAAISIGVKPTFGQQVLTAEAHLIGFSHDDPDVLYGQPARFGFARWIRDQYSFPGVEHLVEQLRRDIGYARSIYEEQSSAII